MHYIKSIFLYKLYTVYVCWELQMGDCRFMDGSGENRNAELSRFYVYIIVFTLYRGRTIIIVLQNTF